MSATAIRVEVVYALPSRRARRELELAAGSSIGEAIRASGLLGEHPEIDLARNRVGILGRLATLDAPLRDGDRVEIYRPLLVDPKDARRRRAAAKERK